MGQKIQIVNYSKVAEDVLSFFVTQKHIGQIVVKLHEPVNDYLPLTLVNNGSSFEDIYESAVTRIRLFTSNIRIVVGTYKGYSLTECCYDNTIDLCKKIIGNKIVKKGLINRHNNGFANS